MPKREDVELERILKDNLISAYLDYIEEFGMGKAQEVCMKTCKGLRDEDFAKILKNNLISAYSAYIEQFGKEKARKMCMQICQGLQDFAKKIEKEI